MNSFILDKFSKQPLSKRLLWTSSTAAIWLFWLYLWSPLLLSASIHLGLISNTDTQDTYFLQQLFTTYANHFLMVILIISLFIFWSLLQQRRKISQSPQDKINIFKQSNSTNNNQQPLLEWRKTERIIIIHYDNFGQMVF